MNKGKFLSILLSVVFFTITQAQTIDSKASKVEFEIGNMKVMNVEGSFTGMQGDIVFNPSNLSQSKFNVCIDAATINTENEDRDAHLKNEDFFDVNKYPKICFESTSISNKGDQFLAKGKLTMHGVTKLVEIIFTYKDKTFIGELTVNRFDYKVGEDTGTFMVSEDAELTIICKLI